MELYQIRYFLAVSRTLNFTQAAEVCNVTQPALTRAIRKLEEELGGDLIRRERTRTHLTQLGQAMLPMLRASFDAAAAAKAEAETFGRGTVAPLRIGLSESVPGRVLAPVLAEVKRAVPGLVLSITRADAGALSRALDCAELDFMVAAAPEATRPDHLRSWPLFEEEMVVCGAGPTEGIDCLSALPVEAVVARPYCESEAESRAAWARAGHETRPAYGITSDRDVPLLTALPGVFALVPRSCAIAERLPATTLRSGAPTRCVRLFEAVGRPRNVAASAFLRLMRATDIAAAARSAAPSSEAVER